MISSEFNFSPDGTFSLNTSVPMTCDIVMSGHYTIADNSNITLNVEDGVATDGSVFSCPASNQAKIGEVVLGIHFLNDNQFYLEDMQSTLGESRCSDGETPLQLFEKIKD